MKHYSASRKTYQFQATQKLRVSLADAWAFFTTPANLAIITPPDLDFNITKLSDEPIYKGMEICYTIKPLLGIPVKWKTVISEVTSGQKFTDIQLEGPYHLWEHTHTFAEREDGLLMTDVVIYRLPFGILGKIAHWLFVRKRIEEIFSYRRKILDKMFNEDGKLVA